jgi:hypothetical protein
MPSLALSTPRRKHFQSFTKQLALPLLAFAFVVAPSFPSTGPFDTAQAASAKKKVDFGLDLAGGALRDLEKAGRAAQKKRGIEGAVGKSIAKWSKGGEKAVGRVEEGVDDASQAASKEIGKNKVGRAAENGWRKAGEWQNKEINNAFRNCRGQACDLGKKGVKFASPFD